MQKITSLEHACEVLGATINLDSFNALAIPGKDIAPLKAQYQIWLITEANNKLNNWEADWSNEGQPKYSVWAPEVVANPNRPAGFGLVFRATYRWSTNTCVGARLNVGSREEAQYIFEDFIELWDTAWLIQEK